MSKLNKSEKADRKVIRDAFVAAGGEIFTFEDAGITIGVKPAVAGNFSTFAHVYVAQLGEGDTFNRKRGELEMLMRFDLMATPLAVRYGMRSQEEIAEDVLAAMAPGFM